MARSICLTCAHSICILHERGLIREDPEVVRCQAVDGRVRQPVLECNHYVYAYAEAPWHMIEGAWFLKTNETGKPIGFKKPSRSGRVWEE